MPIRAVIFDLFDTLVDLQTERLPPLEIGGRRVPGTTPALHAAVAERHPVELETFAEALGQVDGHWREHQYPHGIEFPTVDRFARVLAGLGLPPSDLVGELTEIHMAALRDQAVTPPHHGDCLERLARSVRLGLCSNFSHSPTALGILGEAGLDAHFGSVVVSVDLGIRKPRREIFEAVLAELGADPEATLHVGDNLDADVAGAARLGIRTVWITRRVADAERARAQYSGPDPDYIVNDLEEIESILEAEPH